MNFTPISPDTAISLFEALFTARALQLQPALDNAVQAVGVPTIDAELHRLVPTPALNYLARLHLRGELVFPIPSIILHAPRLIGYYRMLLGISKKDFSQKNKLGYGRWLNAEVKDELPRKLVPFVEELCEALITPLNELVEATKRLKALDDRDLNDLALLTLGPSLQGGRNNIIGKQAATGIFDALRSLVALWITLDTSTLIQFQPPTGRSFELALASDPDVRLDEIQQLGAASGPKRRHLVAIEIKGGRDKANAHNRAGEAEKSHIKAADAGYSERWTMMVLQGLDRQRLQSETPSSTKLLDVDQITHKDGSDWDALKQCFGAVIGSSPLSRPNA